MSNNSCDCEALVELKTLWRKRKPFFMQMEVGAPYSGCLYEPNVFLVTPPGCALQKELQDSIPARWGLAREVASKTLRKAQTAAADATRELDWVWEKARGDWYTFATRPTADELVTLFEAMESAEASQLEAETDFLTVCEQDPTAMPQPKIYVWPLYASGQGMAMDSVHNVRELVEVCESESVFELATRPRWPEGLLGSRLVSDGTGCYGRISLVSVAPLGPINTVLPAAEEYWLKALQIAKEMWDVTLSWECPECSRVYEYDEDQRPEATSSSGNGGIGICLHDVLCRECLSDGACIHCEETTGDPMQYYDSKIKEHGWHLCEWCTEKLLAAANLAGEVDLGDTVELTWWKDHAVGADASAPAQLLFIGPNGRPITGLSFDAEAVTSAAEAMRLEHLNPRYGSGLFLSGCTVENLAYKGL